MRLSFIVCPQRHAVNHACHNRALAILYGPGQSAAAPNDGLAA